MVLGPRRWGGVKRQVGYPTCSGSGRSWSTPLPIPRPTVVAGESTKEARNQEEPKIQNGEGVAAP